MIFVVSFANIAIFFYIVRFISKKYSIFATRMKNKFLFFFFFVLLLPVALGAAARRQVWVIDAGHGGRDVGTEGSKVNEKDITLKVALRVAALVRANLKDVRVVMTRETDRFLTLAQRCAVANQAGGDLFLSIHVNAAPEAPGVSGTETYYGPVGATSLRHVESARRRYQQKSELLAWELQKHYGLVGRSIRRGVKRERYYVVLHTLMPSVLTEIGFITTPAEQAYMTSKQGQEEIAQCIFQGLKDYKETVAAGREKKVLAQMRLTGGCVKGTKPAASTLLAQHAAPSDVTDSVRPQGDTTSDTLPEATPDPALEPEFVPEELTFAIQIFSLRRKVSTQGREFKGLKDVRVREKDGVFKYQCGTCGDYDTARRTLEEVRKTFPDAFIVAFLGDRQISTADAKELYVNKGN